MGYELTVNHLARGSFKADGLRPFFEYRDLGLAQATTGRLGAHVIRGRAHHKAAPTWHRHALDVQLVYVLRGWVEFEYEGFPPVRLTADSCVLQPPRIRHRELRHSDDLELIEITVPAKFETLPG